MGYSAFVFSLLLITISNVCSVGANIWLSEWSNHVTVTLSSMNVSSSNSSSPLLDLENEFYIGIYAMFGILQGIFLLLCALVMAIGMTRAGDRLHSVLFRNVIHSPLAFFETTPLGRILNRCGKDVDIIDNNLAATIRTWMGCILSILSTLIVLSISEWYFVIIVFPMAAVYYFVLRFYVSTSRQLKRLESVTRSPIFSHFQETLSGLICIRAFGAQKHFLDSSMKRLDQNQACYYPNVIANRWLGVRLEMIGNIMVLFAALFAVYGREYFNGGQVGLAVTYALSVTQALNWAVRMTSELESNIVAVERVKEYSELPVETECPTDQQEHLSENWPDKGEIIFENFSLRYRPELDTALKHLTCQIRPQEKVGIAGRTGAGKSTITLGVFRITEQTMGRIRIDNVDISKIGLRDLRSRLTIIPQDPVVFTGTLRSNLDPFGNKPDNELWSVLEKVHLRAFVDSLPDKLDYKIAERCGGENSTISFGQTQLLCLARALLRKSKVIIMDEATASVDFETDELIQATIRKEFADSTILTIAHRLNTIMDSDRIMVLSSGKLIEFDTSKKLLSNPKSLFHIMAKEAGII